MFSWQQLGRSSKDKIYPLAICVKLSRPVDEQARAMRSQKSESWIHQNYN